ncbi:hypothetical protein SPAN111604_01370 [Sphingomonas antarctica]|uniref:hypothetical protein n=1 Tax=Sphingomonas antarctica TaxID=2040274 RepID=UPI0039E75D31
MMDSSNDAIPVVAGAVTAALSPDELDPADLTALREAVAPREARNLDYLLD